jgi:hypothetical protein
VHDFQEDPFDWSDCRVRPFESNLLQMRVAVADGTNETEDESFSLQYTLFSAPL